MDVNCLDSASIQSFAITKKKRQRKVNNEMFIR